jgi:putative tributyrin esterase
MSLLHINYWSAALQKDGSMYVIIPEGDGVFPVVYQLHGLMGDYTAWLRRTSIERYAEELGLMIVMPDGGRSFYTDMRGFPARYEAHLLETVRYIDRTFRTPDAPTARGIGGLSMGAYGAVKLGLKRPDLFACVAVHSGALDMRLPVKGENIPTYEEYAFAFGEPFPPEEDPFALAARPGEKPALYLDCGVDDFFIKHNRNFHRHLTTLGLAHEYHEYPGAHDWPYWDAHAPAALAFHAAHLHV